MKIERSPEKTSVAVHSFLVLAAVVLFAKIIWNITPVFEGIKTVFGYIQPVMYGFVIAFLLNPVLHWFEKKVANRIFKRPIDSKKKRGIAILFTYLAFFTILGVFIWILVPQLVASLTVLINKIPALATSVKDAYGNVSEKMNVATISDANEGIAVLLGKISESINGLLSEITELVGNLLSSIVLGAASIASNIVQVFLGFIISIYLLTGKEKIFAQLRKLGYAFFSQKTVKILENIFGETNRIFSAYVSGAIMDSSIVGIICTVFMLISGMFDHNLWQYSVLIGIIIGTTNVIPYFGPFLGTVPATLILISVNPVFSLVFIVFIVILQQIDSNIINPKIVGDSVGLSALWVVFSLMLFGGMFGIIGMLIGVPMFAVIYTLIKQYTQYLLAKKNLSTLTEDYSGKKNPL